MQSSSNRYPDAPPVGGHERPEEAVSVKASDAEREQAVALLSDHAVAGRLTSEELSERLGAAYSARTRDDLATLTADLPVPRPAESGGREPKPREFNRHVARYLAVISLLVAIWALTGAGYFWPVWPALGWGIGVASHGLGLRAGRPHACGIRVLAPRR